MIEIVYNIHDNSIHKDGYYKTVGKLLMEYHNLPEFFDAVSGGFGRGTLPVGQYEVHAPEKLPDIKRWAGFRGDDFPWRAYLRPLGKCVDDKGPRTELFIHGKGKVPGSLGCLEIAKNDTPCYEVLCKLCRLGKVILKVC